MNSKALIKNEKKPLAEGRRVTLRPSAPQKPVKIFPLYAVFALLAMAIFLFSLDLRNSRRGLTFAMLDVGQGDALFIESPTGTRILVDAGPPRKILGQMARVMPALDRTLDAVIITHPDADHISGFADILENYKVKEIFDPGIADDSALYQNIKKIAEEKSVQNIPARRGMRLNIGGGAVIDILFPDADVRDWETNAGSVVARLSYGDTSILLAGDSPIDTEKIILAQTQRTLLKSTALKVGHHGSKNSSSAEFIEAVAPKYALISAGKENRYGHPDPAVLDIFEKSGIQAFRTDEHGTILMRSDGKTEAFSFYK